jgi:hypothetical protein
MDQVHLEGVLGRRPERRRRELLDDHPDQAHHQDDHDLGDREIDVGQQAPDRAAEPAQRIRAAPGDGPLGRDGGDDVP